MVQHDILGCLATSSGECIHAQAKKLWQKIYLLVSTRYYNFLGCSSSLSYLPSRPVLALHVSTNLLGLPALKLGGHVCKLGLGQPSPIL